jgi:hypothetical protein
MTDRFVDELRQAFEDRAARVETAPDALATIRRRLGSATRRRRLWTITVAGLATSAAAGITAVVLTLPWSAPPPPGIGPTPVPAGPRLPVYVVGTVSGRDLLYREYRSYPGGGSLDDQIKAALTDMIAGRPLDPDYHTAWPAAATVQSVQTAGATIRVDLVGVPGTAPADAEIALQQLIYTATAVAAQEKHTELVNVRVEVNGGTKLWGLDVKDPTARAQAVDIQAPVWLSWPEQGDTVGRSVPVQIVGSVPGAVAMLIVWDEHGSVVTPQPVRLDKGAPHVGTATVTLTLTPGRYRIEAYYLADDGTVAAPDDHVVTVE